MYKTNNGKPELIKKFYQNFVRPIKFRFEQGNNFINRCLSEYFKNMSQDSKGLYWQLPKIKSYKAKLESLENIDLPRFKIFKEKLIAQEKFQVLMDESKHKNLKKLEGIQHLIKYFPEYHDQKLRFLFESKLFDRLDYIESFMSNVGSQYSLVYLT